MIDYGFDLPLQRSGYRTGARISERSECDETLKFPAGTLPRSNWARMATKAQALSL